MQRPSIGLGILVKKEGKVLLLQRKNAHGEGSWCFPGGHIELFETVEQTAKREVLEESGVHIKNIKIIGLTNDFFEKEGKHYFTIFASADWESGEATITEPEKTIQIGWFDWKKPPQPLFIPTNNLHKGNYFPKKRLI